MYRLKVEKITKSQLTIKTELPFRNNLRAGGSRKAMQEHWIHCGTSAQWINIL